MAPVVVKCCVHAKAVGFYSCFAWTCDSTGYKVLQIHYYRITLVQTRFFFF